MALALVTGGAGFIGSNLATELLARGWDVRVFDDLSTGRRANLTADAELVEGDIRDTALMARAMADVSVAFHQAALASVARSVANPVATNEVNVDGTLGVLLAARDAGARVVFASSSSVYGNQDVMPVHEGLACRPISPYGVSKLAGERYLHAFTASYGMPTVALRYFNVFGPRQDPNAEYAAVVPRFIAATLEGRPATIFGDGEQARDFTFVANVVEANLLAAEAGESAWGGAFNIGCSGRHTVNELLAAIRGQVGGEGQPAVHEPPRPGDVRESHASIDAARGALGYVPAVGFEEGIARTVAWYREQGVL
jgi:nucleoside-diphosphate-sugar epimerase